MLREIVAATRVIRECSRAMVVVTLIEFRRFMGFSPCFTSTELRWQGKQEPSARVGQTQAKAALAGRSCTTGSKPPFLARADG